MGILGTAGAGGRGKLSEVEKKVTVSSICRRRLSVVMTRLSMADTVQAVSIITTSQMSYVLGCHLVHFENMLNKYNSTRPQSSSNKAMSA